MSDEKLQEISDKLDKLTKTVSKLLNINTKIAKTLHLLPVTEKEERDLQILQRTNLKLAAKVNDELNAMENVPAEEDTSYFDIFGIDSSNVFGDVLGDDYLS